MMDKRIKAQIEEMIWHEENVLQKDTRLQEIKKGKKFPKLNELEEGKNYYVDDL